MGRRCGGGEAKSLSAPAGSHQLLPKRTNKRSSNPEGEQKPTEMGYNVSMAVSREQETSWCADNKPQEPSDYLTCPRTALIKTKTQKRYTNIASRSFSGEVKMLSLNLSDAPRPGLGMTFSHSAFDLRISVPLPA